jgi:antitoxin FitA
MAQLIVRNLEDEVVQALQRRAADHGRSAEAEHREILKAALLPDGDFKEFLMSMPEVPEAFDECFEFGRGPARDVDL